MRECGSTPPDPPQGSRGLGLGQPCTRHGTPRGLENKRISTAVSGRNPQLNVGDDWGAMPVPSFAPSEADRRNSAQPARYNWSSVSVSEVAGPCVQSRSATWLRFECERSTVCGVTAYATATERTMVSPRNPIDAKPVRWASPQPEPVSDDSSEAGDRRALQGHAGPANPAGCI
ncbi:hypothetical protein C8Q77DRAFT_244291 [Trametes polyzona]|nr:hypothetical protein C8Q77DRAFT_244291 [Trametes polyzona]